MIFSDDRYQQALDGTKTKTRRLVQPNEVGLVDERGTIVSVWIDPTFDHNYDKRLFSLPISHGCRLKWGRYQTYAIQPGRGKPAGGYFELVSLTLENIQEITLNEALKEGFESLDGFIQAWNSIHFRDPDHWFQADPLVWVLGLKVESCQVQVR